MSVIFPAQRLGRSRHVTPAGPMRAFPGNSAGCVKKGAFSFCQEDLLACKPEAAGDHLCGIGGRPVCGGSLPRGTRAEREKICLLTPLAARVRPFLEFQSHPCYFFFPRGICWFGGQGKELGKRTPPAKLTPGGQRNPQRPCGLAGLQGQTQRLKGPRFL